jgi:lysophospholipase L1-like esterase
MDDVCAASVGMMSGLIEQSILCYGDSNTWGYVPLTAARLVRAERWPTLLQSHLGHGYHVIAEGLNGRTTAWDEPFRPGRNGRESLLPLLESHAPLALVIIMLGTNDLKHHLNVSAHESARGLSTLIKIAQKSETGINAKPPEVLVLAPPIFGELSELMAHHFEAGCEKSRHLSRHYRQACADLGCHFFDTNAEVSVGADGIHLDAAGQQRLAKVLAPMVRQLTGGDGAGFVLPS